MSHRILLVEDDPDLSRGVRFNLEHERYAVTCALTAAAARAAHDRTHDLVILDLNLPDGDGLDLLRQWRARGDATPILCLTARAQETDVVMGLGLGADDYLRKPFGLAELLARVSALLRRSPNGRASLEGDNRVHIGDAIIDRAAHQLVRGDLVEPLTPIEMQLFEYLFAARGKAVDRAQLLKDLWGVDQSASTRTLDNHIARLRKKLEIDPANPKHLVTVHGVGYRLDEKPRATGTSW